MHPKDVDALVFWTRNPAPLFPHLAELDAQGYAYLFQFTLTGYPRSIETSVPDPDTAVKTFSCLSDWIGRERVIWRYDPVLVSNQVPVATHKRLFARLARQLSGKTRRVTISFADFYKKTERNLKQVEGLICTDITRQQEELQDLAAFMARTAREEGMEIQSCAEPAAIRESGILPGKCLDDDWLKAVFGLALTSKKDKGQRPECGCIPSVDIGSYNTCLHGCAYCYATYNHQAAIENKRQHDPTSPFLVGGIEGIDPALLQPAPSQQQLF